MRMQDPSYHSCLPSLWKIDLLVLVLGPVCDVDETAALSLGGPSLEYTPTNDRRV